MTRIRVFTIVVAIALLTSAVLADDIPLRSGTAVPAAIGKLEYSTDRNGNTALEIKAEHLAPPQNLTPPKQDYVVWIEAPGQPAENKGVLRVNNDQQASIKMITPHKNFDVFVTAEDNPAVTTPSGTEVLRGALQVKK